MSAQVYSVPGQTEGKNKAFFEWESIDLSYELTCVNLLHVGLILTIIKVFIILFRENRKHPVNNNSVSFAFN